MQQSFFDQTTPDTPEYSIRVSPRARSVNLKVTPEDGLTIVVPRQFKMDELPAILDEKRTWIDNALSWADEQRRIAATIPPVVVPAIIDLPAVHETWSLQRVATDAQGARARACGYRRLRVSGNIYDTTAVTGAMKRWLSRRARQTVVPRLDSLASRHGFEPVKKTTIRNQQTCWASYSPTGTISINQKLLFIPPRLLEYVLIHELCHTVHLNHSRRFWNLVGSILPHFHELKKELSAHEEMIPRWASE